MSAKTTTTERPLSRYSDALILIFCLGAVWQLFYELAGSVAMAPPLATAAHAWGLVRSSDFWPHAAVTLTAFAIALAISISAGVLLGLVLGFRKFAGEVVEPVLISLYTVPKVAFYPVILLFLGIGMAAEITFGVIHGIIPVAIFTMNAVRTIKPVLIKTARVMKLTWSQMMWTILVPAATPEIFTGIRIGFSLTFIGTLLSEMFGSKQGLGYMLMNAIGLNAVDLIMSLTFLIVVSAVTVNILLLALDKRLHRRV